MLGKVIMRNETVSEPANRFQGVCSICWHGLILQAQFVGASIQLLGLPRF